MRKITIFILLVVSLVSAQVEHSGGKNPYSTTPRFYLDIAGYPTNLPGKTRIDIFLKMPYTSVQFIKDNDKYIGGYSVSLTFYDEDGEKILFESMWNEQIVVNSFNATNSGKSFNISYKSSNLKPGDYKIKCIVEDKDSKKNYAYVGELNIKNLDLPIAISDVIFIEKVVNDESGQRIIPSVNNIFTNVDTEIGFFYEIHADTSKKVIARYTVLNAEEEEEFTQDIEYNINKGRNSVKYSFRFDKISLGQYKLKVLLINEDDDEIIGTSKFFRNKLFGFPITITDIDEAVDQMMYIASNDEIGYIKETEDPDTTLERYIEYWKQKDPSPNTIENEVLIEYYRRVAYANENFKSYYPGWKTDMGMIYITLGAPDNVDRHPMDYNSKPYELWDYYEINRRFVFVDQTGFGDYRLLNPVYGDWYRYRN